MGFLLLFDLTNEQSFLNVRNWMGASASSVNPFLFFHFPVAYKEKVVSNLPGVLGIFKCLFCLFFFSCGFNGECFEYMSRQTSFSLFVFRINPSHPDPPVSKVLPIFEINCTLVHV